MWYIDCVWDPSSILDVDFSVCARGRSLIYKRGIRMVVVDNP